EDLKDILSLYEASHLAYEGEDILDKAKTHTTKYLKNILLEMDSSDNYEFMKELIRHSLEIPLHRRMVMLEARWYIESCKKKEGTNMTLLELAKLEFNIAQSVLQQDLKSVSWWWNNPGLAKELSFSRDRLVECFFVAVSLMYEPQFSSYRQGLRKVALFITTIDDIYDIYGTMSELELFTDAVERWDIDVVQSLPNYMKICFLALYNTINEMAYGFLRKHGYNIIPNLAKLEEIARGGTVNSISCYMNDNGVNEEQARQHIKVLIDGAWKKMNQELFFYHKGYNWFKCVHEIFSTINDQFSKDGSLHLS
ncbi:unnamed protein product, partial [Linum tenue]